MTGNRLSMSRLWLVYLCGWWARPDVYYAEPPSGRPARVGSATHSLQEIYLNGNGRIPNDVADDELAEARRLMDGPYKAWLDATQWEACEIGLRYDAETDRAVEGPRRGDPGYDDHGPMILKGTLDLVSYERDGENVALVVVDTKTGQPRNCHAEQLYGQAVAATRYYALPSARVGFVFPRKTKVIEPIYETLDADRLDYEAGRIRRALRLIPTSQPNPGDHCWRCPARTVCPEHWRDEYAGPVPDEARVYDDNVGLF